MQDVRADHLGLYGYVRETSPSLDELAKQSIVYERDYASTSDPVAAMGTLLTGRYPPEHGLLYTRPLDPGLTTIASLLASHGYQTHLITADPETGEQSGLTAGFEKVDAIDPAADPALDGGTATVTKHALDWLRSERDRSRPYFLMLVYSGAQLPWNPPEPFKSRFTEAWMGDKAIDRGSAVWTPLARRVNSGEIKMGPGDMQVLGSLYDGEIAYLDSKIGELIQGLRDDKTLDDAYLLVTSDHGDDLGDGGHLSDPTSLSDASLQVPLIIRQPGGMGGGTRVKGIVQDADVMATICDVLKILKPPSASPLGTSLAPLGKESHRASAISVGLRRAGPRVMDLVMSVRDQRYRYDLAPEGPLSLKDLDVKGPGLEILETSPEIARRLQAQLSAWDSGLLTAPKPLRPITAVPAKPEDAGGTGSKAGSKSGSKSGGGD